MHDVSSYIPPQKTKQLYIKTDKTAAAAMVPPYLVGMADPRESPTIQMVSFYRFFPDPKDDEGCDVRVFVSCLAYMHT
jgi:hypothetical protein